MVVQSGRAREAGTEVTYSSSKAVETGLVESGAGRHW